MRYKKITIEGKVQGVSFREFVRREASRLGELSGYVKNLNNGNVAVVVKGDESKIKELVDKCKRGPLLASVKNVNVEEVDLDEDYDSFFVKF